MSPLTTYLARLLRMTPQELAAADYRKGARQFGIRLADARGYLEQQCTLRGVRMRDDEPAKEAA